MTNDKSDMLFTSSALFYVPVYKLTGRDLRRIVKESKLADLNREIRQIRKQIKLCDEIQRETGTIERQLQRLETEGNTRQIISSAMKLAIQQKRISSNPADGCALPRIEYKEMKTLPADQLSAFLNEAKHTGTFELYYIDLATGLRRGELLGLKWQDVGLDNGVIHVRRQIGRIDGMVQEAPLKTKNAYCNISIGADAVSILREKKKQDGGRSEYVFPSSTGGPMSPDSVLKMLHRVL